VEMWWGLPGAFLDMFAIPWEEKSISCSFAPRGKKIRGAVKGAEEEQSLSLEAWCHSDG